MTWLRLDDKMSRHAKIVGLTDPAFRLHIHALLYCAEQATDGRVLSAAAPTLSAHRNKPALIKELVDAGLWETLVGGWEIHDFLDWNPSKEETEKKRDARAAAGRVGGNRSAYGRRRTDGEDDQAIASANGQAESKQLLHGLLVTGFNPVPARPEDPDGSSNPPNPHGETAEDVGSVFRHWLTVLSPLKFKRPPSLTPERRRIIASRLKEFTPAELCLAIDGVRKSTNHCGQNETGEVYVEFETIFRNRTKVEGHIARAEGPARVVSLPNEAVAKTDNAAQEAALRRARGQ